jgi:hypothetical protein
VSDLGKKEWSSLISHQPKKKTVAPTFKQLMKQGISLDSLYAEPTCSPSRVAIMTGRRSIIDTPAGDEEDSDQSALSSMFSTARSKKARCIATFSQQPCQPFEPSPSSREEITVCGLRLETYFFLIEGRL